MAKCSGCTGDLSSVSHSDTNCIHLTGDGTASDPLIATLQIDPASPDTITCGVDGLSVVGSSSMAVTVAGPDTLPEHRNQADFIADGVSDDVEIQAAIDYIWNSGFVAIVFLLPGFYNTTSSIDTFGIPIYGWSPSQTAIQASNGVRVFDNTGSNNEIELEGLDIGTDAAAAIVVPSGRRLKMRNCSVGGGAGAGIDAFTISLTNGENGTDIANNRIVSRDGSHNIDINGGGAFRINNNSFFGSGIHLLNVDVIGGAGYGCHIGDNAFVNIGSGSTVLQGIFLENSRGTSIVGNSFLNCQEEAILISGSQDCLIADNHIMSYAAGTSLTDDGIRLTGDSDRNTIQGNVVRARLTFGRHGINISAATCNDNFVTNNDLLNSGAGTSINDAGTATITAAGNRL